MSEAIEVKDDNDMPCEDWKNTEAEVKNCPMQEDWHEGETRVCPVCGWAIYYNFSGV